MEYETVTLTVNPAIDLSTSVDRLEPFSKLRCNEAKRDPGGGGINVARALRRFGQDVCAVYPAGGCTGDLLQQLMRREKVESRVIPIQEETREDFTVVTRASSEQFRFVLPGPALTQDELQNVLAEVRKTLRPGGILVASGSLPPGAPSDYFASAATVAAAQGARFVLDTSGAALTEALSQPIFLLKPNLREFQSLIGQPAPTMSQRVTAAHHLIRTFGIGMIALTLADEGAILVRPEGAWFATAPKIQAISTVGTGDSFLAALVWRLALGDRPADALRYGVAAGSAALLAPGTELCRLDDVSQLLPHVVVRDTCELQCG